MSAGDTKFCPLCGVRLDLHDGPDTCHRAEAQAEFISGINRMIGQVMGR